MAAHTSPKPAAVVPLATSPRSSTNGRRPRSVRWNATEQPTAPAPTMRCSTGSIAYPPLVRRLGQRQAQPEAAPPPRLALHRQRPAVMLHDLAADRQPQPRPVRLAGQRVAHLAELLEDRLALLRRHARAGVLDLGHRPAVQAAGAYPHPP